MRYGALGALASRGRLAFDASFIQSSAVRCGCAAACRLTCKVCGAGQHCSLVQTCRGPWTPWFTISTPRMRFHPRCGRSLCMVLSSHGRHATVLLVHSLTLGRSCFVCVPLPDACAPHLGYSGVAARGVHSASWFWHRRRFQHSFGMQSRRCSRSSSWRGLRIVRLAEAMAVRVAIQEIPCMSQPSTGAGHG